ncbi:MAG TPA: hypothetical protein VLO30_00835 [Chthoniobacterales bacterium]|nr:hypothetical protein [Chthoniobacterales bacterium]
MPLVKIFAPRIATAALWLWLFLHLQVEWSFNPNTDQLFDRKRNLGQRLVEVAVLGLDDFVQAREALSKTAEEIMRLEKIKG